MYKRQDNIERALIDVYRNDTSELTSFDFKMSNSEAFSLPAGPVGMLLGMNIAKSVTRMIEIQD